MMKKSTTIVRIIFGLMLLGFVVSGLLNLVPPLKYADPADQFLVALVDTGYIMMIVLILKVIVGACLLINRFVPLALVLFMPISVNMFLFHVFLDITSILPALVILFLNAYLLVAYIENYKPFLTAKN